MLYVDLKVGNNFHPLKGLGCKEILVQITYLLYSYMLRCCQLKTLGIAKKVPKSIGIRQKFQYWSSLFDTGYRLAGEAGKCTDDGLMITTEAECEKACNSLERNFNVGRNLVNPGCFVNTQRTGNCQWANIVWGSRKGDKAVCKACMYKNT